jgi:hypothetical protein
MRAIERASDVRTSYLAASGTSTVVVRNVPVEYLYRGELAQSTDAPLAYNGSAAPRLGDRIVNLKATGVPFGLRGTVVAMHSSTGYVEVHSFFSPCFGEAIDTSLTFITFTSPYFSSATSTSTCAITD